MRVPRVTVDMMAAVIALAEKKSLGTAGKELGLTLSSVHKRIQAANQLFGTRLFTGTNEGVRLTEAGEVFYAHAVKAMEQILLTEETTIGCAESGARYLRVGHSTHLPPRMLALLHDLHLSSALGVRLEHKSGLTGNLVQDVVGSTLHAGLGILPVAHPELLIYQLTEEPLVVCMPSTHRLANKPTIRPRDLEGEPIVAISRETFPILHRQIEDFFEDFGIELNIVADAFGPPEAIAMTEQRVALCLVAASSLRARGSVVARTLSPQTLTRRCGLFVREDNRHPLLKCLVDLLLKKTTAWQTID